MNKVVRHHYPVSKLPEELREGFSSGGKVKILIEEEPHQEKPMTLEEMFKLAQPTFASAQEVDEYVRSMRDDWERGE